MMIRTYADGATLNREAAGHAADLLRGAIYARGAVRIIAATGTSQVGFLEALTAMGGIDWARVELFHLDEYIGIPMDHPASFCRYLLERLIVKAGITRYHLLEGDSDVAGVVERAGQEINRAPIDVAFVGIGENGHLAFNDPPADFATDEPYLIVDLDGACRMQQVSEGWFASLSEVPTRAISMSVRQILKAREIIAVVPESRKAQAVGRCLEGDVSPLAPASILRAHPNTTVYLDRESAALLSPSTRGEILDKP